MKAEKTWGKLRIWSLFRRRSTLLIKLLIILTLLTLLDYSKLFDIVGKLNLLNKNGQHTVERGQAGDNYADTNKNGELGQPYLLPLNIPDDVRILVDNSLKMFGYNQYVSDQISVNRSLPDVRPEGCQTKTYSNDLPKASVIICFYNEAWSVLLRTIHSVLNRSPQHLLEEIILVDNNSNMTHLGLQLEDYVRRLNKVHLIRTNETGGQTRARLHGTAVAKGPVLIFLDSHCECTTGWLEPLLQRIHDNSTTVVSPALDDIDGDSFEYLHLPYPTIRIGGFNWNLTFQQFMLAFDRKRNIQKRPWDLIWTPVISGQAFAINKKFFLQLGGFDDGFGPGGGENIELSFKTWMCGGTLEVVPCSYVGHVGRAKLPQGYPFDVQKNSIRNRVRVAEVWLDEYKWLFDKRIRSDAGNIGDVKPRKELRSRLNCTSFEWYMRNVHAEQTDTDTPLAFGEIRNLGKGSDSCIDGGLYYQEPRINAIIMNKCTGKGGRQFWELTKNGRIKQDTLCFDYAAIIDDVIMYGCHGEKNQEWTYDPQTHSIRNSQTGKCLVMTKNKKRITLENCTGGEMQQWKFGIYTGIKLPHFSS